MAEFESAKLASEEFRKIAARQGDAISRYGDLVTKYSKGEIDVAHMTREGMQLYWREGYALFEDAIRLSAVYWQWVAELMGATVGKVPARPDEKAVSH
jgi:hypothetical protein